MGHHTLVSPVVWLPQTVCQPWIQGSFTDIGVLLFLIRFGVCKATVSFRGKKGLSFQVPQTALYPTRDLFSLQSLNDSESFSVTHKVICSLFKTDFIDFFNCRQYLLTFNRFEQCRRIIQQETVPAYGCRLYITLSAGRVQPSWHVRFSSLTVAFCGSEVWWNVLGSFDQVDINPLFLFIHFCKWNKWNRIFSPTGLSLLLRILLQASLFPRQSGDFLLCVLKAVWLFWWTSVYQPAGHWRAAHLLLRLLSHPVWLRI